MDQLSLEKRSWNMSRIRSRDTRPELILRKALYGMKFRYRLHARTLPGSPDLVFPKYKAVIFVHGCFWHRHGCKATATPLTNQEFWLKKFADTITRDKRNIQDLLDCGWRVAIVWECVLRGKKELPDIIATELVDWLHSELKL
ncbi:MAG: DNA mismatch endonuclease Vsr, partial [Chlorobiaceae bacterium]|nr:DNA mismatch endonuclease Vsr [Chlorobiaceae bacterium]